MFNEHVWEKYFMVSRSHQTFSFSQTCSLNMPGKNLTPWWSPEGGTFPRHVHQNLRKFIPRKEKRCLPKVVEMCNASTRMEKVENFPIWKNRKIFFQNLMNWNICSWGKFFDKSENFPLFQLFRKFQNFVPISRANGEIGNFSYKIRWISTFADGNFSNLEKSENFLLKFDYL